MTESVESKSESLVTVGTGELLQQLMVYFLSAMVERLTVPRAMETETSGLLQLIVAELSTSGQATITLANNVNSWNS